MSELFEIPEVLSPRLAWIKKHDVQTKKAAFACNEDEHSWIAWCGDLQFAIDKGAHGTGTTEDEAITNLAKDCGWRLWNEE